MEQAKGQFNASSGNWQSQPTIVLQDVSSGAEATIVPGLGANLVAWSIEHNGHIELIETPPTPEDLRTHRFRAGMPVLWPFPGRVRDARYKFDGREYQLPRTDKGGVHHIHGIVVDAAWQVAEHGTTANDAYATLAIGPNDLDEAMRAGYPFDFSLSLTFRLCGQQLMIDTRVENRETQSELPFGYGLHPYFRAPLVPSTTTPDRKACLVQIPAATQWPTEGGIPNGPVQPVATEKDFQQWRAIGDQLFDDMYSNLEFAGDWCVAGYRDPGAQLEIQVKADRHFREWVFFTHPTHPSLCIEPYTCPPNAINFAEEHLDNSGLILLKPGEIWQARVIFDVVSVL